MASCGGEEQSASVFIGNSVGEIVFVACEKSYVDSAKANFEQVIFSEPSAYVDSFPQGRDFIVINEQERKIDQSIRETYYDFMSADYLKKILDRDYLYDLDGQCYEELNGRAFTALRARDNRFFLCNLKFDGSKWVLTAKHLCQR